MLEIPSHSIFLMLLGNVHEVFDKLELELERSTRDCNWQSVTYLQGSQCIRKECVAKLEFSDFVQEENVLAKGMNWDITRDV